MSDVEGDAGELELAADERTVMTCMHYTTPYSGPLKLAVLDLAGTVVDFGSLAPTGAFIELFARHGIALADAEVRGPMGMHKRDHIAALCDLPDVQKAWRECHGRAITGDDIDKLYADFIPLQLETLSQYAEPVPGAAAAIAALRARGLLIGFTTGYSREMTNVVLAAAAARGLVADVVVCATEVPAGRPAPWMAMACAQQTGVYPPAACIKFGDTLVDIGEGRHAGMWSVGAAVTGNMAGCSQAEWESLPADRQQAIRESAREAFLGVGAHAVLDGIADLPDLVDAINVYMKKGGAPDIVA
jgi:phosphonoacetaldehyde hydrolase